MTARAVRARASRRAGSKAELLAESYLVRQGYLPLARNHVVRGGEVDLVVRQGALVVFVEVKKRPSADLALESVTVAKQRRIVRAALDYLRRARLEDRPVRFDVLALTKARARAPEFVHVEGAFDASAAGERGLEA